MSTDKKYGIIADIHANYVALRGVLNYLNGEGVDKILCLGDLVAYGDEPFKCIDAIRDTPNAVVIAGDYDRMVVGHPDPRLHGRAKETITFTAENISAEHASYLRGLPDKANVDDRIVMVHDSIMGDGSYILSPQEVGKNLEAFVSQYPDYSFCFFGHTHLPVLIGTDSVVTDLSEGKQIQLSPEEKYLINPGSVGDSRRAAFAILDTAHLTIDFMRVGFG